MYMHPDFYYLFISPFETNPHLDKAWQIKEFHCELEAREYIAKFDYTKGWYLFQFKEILELLDQKAELDDNQE